jgi:hypothetical protein
MAVIFGLPISQYLLISLHFFSFSPSCQPIVLSSWSLLYVVFEKYFCFWFFSLAEVSYFIKKRRLSQVWWLKSIMLATWEEEMGGGRNHVLYNSTVYTHFSLLIPLKVICFLSLIAHCRMTPLPHCSGPINWKGELQSPDLLANDISSWNCREAEQVLDSKIQCELMHNSHA